MGTGAGYERIPDAVYAKIFQLLPPSQIAGVCSLVCKAWRDVASDSILWQHLCIAAGLSSSDCLRCLGGWKSLFGIVFGQNLTASPNFESVHHMDADRIKNRALSPWEPKHRLLLDRICSLDEDHEEHHFFSYWAVEGGSVFQRGGGDGIVRESPPLGCPPCPVAPEKPVLATSYEWGKVQQYVGLQTFSNKFLDSSPPLVISAWYAGRRGTASKFKATVHLRDELKNTLLTWDSGEVWAREGQWREVKRIIRGYPAGMRSIIVKIAGTSVSSTEKRGFHGAKFTSVRLQFLPPLEVENHDAEQLGKIIEGGC